MTSPARSGRSASACEMRLAQQQPHRRVAAKLVGQILGFDRRDHVVVGAVEEKDRRRRLRRLRRRQRRVAGVGADVGQQPRAEVHDVAVVDVAQQGRRRLRQRARELARAPRTRCAAAACRRRVSSADASRYRRTAARSGVDLRRRHHAIGDAEQKHGDAVVVRRRARTCRIVGRCAARAGAAATVAAPTPVHR